HAELRVWASSTRRSARSSITARGRRLAELARGPSRSLHAERQRLHQLLREVRAAATRGLTTRRELAARHALVLGRKGSATAAALGEGALALQRLGGALAGRGRGVVRRELGRIEGPELALRGHDPQRTLERGYELVEDEAGEPVTSALVARARGRLRVRFTDDAVRARIEERANE